MATAHGKYPGRGNKRLVARAMIRCEMSVVVGHDGNFASASNNRSEGIMREPFVV